MSAAAAQAQLRLCRRIVSGYANKGIPGTAKRFGITENEVRDHYSARCGCPDALQVARLWRGQVRAQAEHIDGEGGRWHALGGEGTSRIWVSE